MTPIPETLRIILRSEAIGRTPSGTHFDVPQLLQRQAKGQENVCPFPIKDHWLDIGRPDDFGRVSHDYNEVSNA